MNIGIFYATYSGGTQMAADFLTQSLKASGHTVDMKPIVKVSFVDTLSYDLRIFASPSWDNDGKEGQPHIDFISFMEKSAGKKFSNKPCVVFGLGDISYGHFCGAVDHLEKFIKKSGGKLVTESLRIDNYLIDMDGYNKKLAEWAKSFKV
ncbi:MAG: Flavodoxin [Candidatus Roizmanbacteria bacterium GW2011_GWA2_34_18]|uniref:Flavodoxin n=1 Tax=Candidatus Roizmanbacteria bacterium GW2011_GWA2_34_18 TaxID=1618477 RepID=A0A0G0DDL7_9BACT|nr:MAG: Flavodoxin [Candidatus Roizmanbacteria bacterium GW2011_GWA2_34_18]